MTDLKQKCMELYNRLKEEVPIVYQISNDMIMTDTSNALLSLGAEPVAARCKEELDEVVEYSNSLVLNISNIDILLIESMKSVLNRALDLNKPVVLDATGVGITRFRRYTCFKLLEEGKVNLLRANPYEVLVLSGDTDHEKGKKVMARDVVNQAHDLAVKYNISVLVPGKRDYLVSSDRAIAVSNGVNVSSKVFSSTAILSSFCAAFMAVSEDDFLASAAGTLVYRVAGEIAVERGVKGPGTYLIGLLDALYGFSDEDIMSKANISFLEE